VPLDVSQLARATVERFGAADPDRKVDVVVDDGLVAKGDARLVEILLDNLIDNAWKYTANRRARRSPSARSPVHPPTTLFVRGQTARASIPRTPRSSSASSSACIRTKTSKARESGSRRWIGSFVVTAERSGEGEADRGAVFYFTLGGRSRR